MFVKSAVMALLATTATASVIKIEDSCGNIEPTAEQLEAAREMGRKEAMTSFADDGDDLKATTNVPVYVHVVAAGNSTDEGYVSESDIKTQISVMNTAYANTTFQFDLKKIDYTVNKNWSENGDDYAMKDSLRVGDYKTLNIYYQTDLGHTSTSRTLGYCHFPTTTSEGEKSFTLDGCNVVVSSLAEGTTTPHEVGHWMGLFHTFQGGCTGDGDMVADTPACKKDTSCKEGTDTCPDVEGLDMIHNYMAYGRCRYEFTDGQATRMRSSYDKYRA